MSSILVNLPDELLLSIVDRLWLPELVDFACTCRAFSSLSYKRLRLHVDLARRFGSWRWPFQALEADFAHGEARLGDYIDLRLIRKPPESPADTPVRTDLQSSEIFDPRFPPLTWKHLFWMFYWINAGDAKEHVYRLPLVSHSNQNHEVPAAIYVPPDTSSSLYQVAEHLSAVGQPKNEDSQRRLLRLLGELVQFLLKSVAAHHEPDPYRSFQRARESLSILMLLACPNVHTLDVMGTKSDQLNVRSAIGKSLLDISMNVSPRGNLLRHLRTVHWHGAQYDWTDLNSIVPFLCLPTVTHMTMAKCIHYDGDNVNWPLNDRVKVPQTCFERSRPFIPPKKMISNVTDIQFTDSLVAKNGIRLLAEHLTRSCALRIEWPASGMVGLPLLAQQWMDFGGFEDEKWSECRVDIEPHEYMIEQTENGNLGLEKHEGTESKFVEFLDEHGYPLE